MGFSALGAKPVGKGEKKNMLSTKLATVFKGKNCGNCHCCSILANLFRRSEACLSSLPSDMNFIGGFSAVSL